MPQLECGNRVLKEEVLLGVPTDARGLSGRRDSGDQPLPDLFLPVPTPGALLSYGILLKSGDVLGK